MKTDPVIYHRGYYRAANRLRGARYTVLAAFVLFTLLLFFLFRQDMTLNHFRYLLRNLDFSSNLTATSGDTMYYSGEADSEFGFVDGGLACVTPTRVFVTDRASGTTFSHYHGYTEPRAVFSEKYMAVYDRRGSSLSLYNAFAHLETLTFEGTVLAAALSDDGELAVAVSEKGQYYSTVYVYSPSLKIENKLSKYKYVTDLALSRNGKQLAVASLCPDGVGGLGSELLLMTVGEKKATLTESFSAESIVTVGFTDEDALAAVTDKAYRLYGKKGDLLVKTDLEERPDRVYLSGSSLLTLTGGADSRFASARVYSDRGESLFSLPSVSYRLKSVVATKEGWYLLASDGLTFLEEETGKRRLLVPTEERFGFLLEKGAFVYDGETLYYATDSSAKALKDLFVGEEN